MPTGQPAALEEARRLLAEGDHPGAVRAATSVLDRPGDFAALMAADRLLAQATAAAGGPQWARRDVRVALASSHTSAQLAAALRVAAARHGIAIEVHETGYRAYEQEILDPSSALYAARPDVVVLVADHRELRLPARSDRPEEDLSAELARWRGLWARIQEQAAARVIMTTFVPPPTDALGQLGMVLPGARHRQIQRLNLALGEDLPAGVALVDAVAVAMRAGTDVWFDPRYWYLSKHAVGLGAVGRLAGAVADILAAALGLSRKVVVLDLDNTLWGGVIGEDGLGGIELGGTPAGEAYVDVQEYVRALTARGLVLAVCSKNNPEDARLPFEQHPDMRLTLADFVAFEASWDDKPSVLRRIAQRLDVGLDALVFVDDNPVEREAVRRQLPQVGVVELPRDASGYLRALADFPGLQSVALTEEDRRRTAQYQARTAAHEAATGAATREDFLAGLEMTATIEDLSEANLGRIVQLIGKTNQLNLTTRRHGAAEVQALAARDGSIVWGVRVRDRFDDHGLVAVLIAVPDGDDLDVDTFLMSCRVLGRTVEQAVLGALVAAARAAGFASVTATYLPTERNAPAAAILPEAGFSPVDEARAPADAGAADATPGRDDAVRRRYRIATDSTDPAAAGSPYVEVIRRQPAERTT